MKIGGSAAGVKAKRGRGAQRTTAFDQIKDYLGKVAAHVPTEIVSIYAMGKSFAPDYADWWTILCWVLSVIFRWVGTQGEGKVLNVILTTIAFPIWAIALGGTILGWAPPSQLTGLSVLGFSAIAGFLYNNK